MKKKSSKKKIALIIGIIIIFIIISFVVYYFISINNINKNSRKMESIVSEVKENNINYVFLDINPSFTLVIQNDVVSQVVCRNDDCLELKKSLNIKGKDLVNAVETIYNTATEKGYDTKDGIYIKTTIPLSQKLNTNYIHIETIEKNEEESLLKENIDKIEIELTDNEKLIEKLKKDEDYGNIYTCSIINNNVECYLNDNMKNNGETHLLQEKRIASVLNRFGIKTESVWEMGVVEEPLFRLYIDGSKFVNLGGNGINNMSYIGTYNCNTVRFNLKDLNLLNPSDIQEHFYVGKYDIVQEEHINEKIVISKSCYSGKCKEHYSINNYYCNYTKNEFEGNVTMHYVIYNEDGSNHQELTEDQFNDYEVAINAYISTLPECEIVEPWYNQNGNPHPTYKSPYGKYCKYLDENNKWVYASCSEE